MALPRVWLAFRSLSFTVSSSAEKNRAPNWESFFFLWNIYQCLDSALSDRDCVTIAGARFRAPCDQKVGMSRSAWGYPAVAKKTRENATSVKTHLTTRKKMNQNRFRVFSIRSFSTLSSFGGKQTLMTICLPSWWSSLSHLRFWQTELLTPIKNV